MDKIALQPPATSPQRLAEVFGVPKSTTGRLVQNESNLCKQLLEEQAPSESTPGSKRDAANVCYNYQSTLVTAKTTASSPPRLYMQDVCLLGPAEAMWLNNAESTVV